MKKIFFFTMLISAITTPNTSCTALSDKMDEIAKHGLRAAAAGLLVCYWWYRASNFGQEIDDAVKNNKPFPYEGTLLKEQYRLVTTSREPLKKEERPDGGIYIVKSLSPDSVDAEPKHAHFVFKSGPWFAPGVFTLACMPLVALYGFHKTMKTLAATLK